MIIWRRHIAPCESEDRTDSRCGCPIYQEFRINGKRFRRSLKTTNWQKALADARRREMEDFKEKQKSPTIQQACDKYLLDAEARELREPTLYKFRLLFRQIQEFGTGLGLVFVSDFNLDYLRQFRASWPNKNEAARVKLGNLRAFFRFCQKSKWIEDNPALDLKPGKIAPSKIVPLTHDEFKLILESCSGKKYIQRLRTLILVLWFTGLSIRDAVCLRRDAIHDGKLFLRRAKTGVDVNCPLPEQVLNALTKLPTTGDYYFWSGRGKPKSAVGDYQRSLRRIFRQAGVPRAFPHLFRHTFATRLLQDGVSVQSVATLLGHSSTRITEKTYSHWIKARQMKLEDEVKNSWGT